MSEPWSATAGAGAPVAAVPNPAREKLAPLGQRRKAEIDAVMAKYPVRRSGVMALLHMVQEDEGWISPEAMAEVAEICVMQPSEVMEMVSFYTMYHREPVGKYVLWVCGTLPCALCGADGLFEYLKSEIGVGLDEVSADGLFTIKRAECLGACSEAPLMQVNDKMEIRLTRAKVDNILGLCRAGQYEKDYARRVEQMKAQPGKPAEPGQAPGVKPKPVGPAAVKADPAGAGQGSREGASRAHQPGGSPVQESPQAHSAVAPKNQGGGTAPSGVSEERTKKITTERTIDAGAKVPAEAVAEPADPHAPIETPPGNVAKGLREEDAERGSALSGKPANSGKPAAKGKPGGKGASGGKKKK